MEKESTIIIKSPQCSTKVYIPDRVAKAITELSYIKLDDKPSKRQ